MVRAQIPAPAPASLVFTGNANARPCRPATPGQPAGRTDPQAVAAPIRVILADDHPIVLLGLVTLLRQDPAISILVETRDGIAALEAIQTYRPHVAVLDIEMPGKSGLEVAAEIQLAGLPVQSLFVTSHRDEVVFNQAMNLGVKGYVLKDSALDDLRTAVKTVAAGRRFISAAMSDHLYERGYRTRELAGQRPGLEMLTPMERRVLRMVAMDQTSKAIADTLGISHRTVENHRANCASKLSLRGSHSLLKFAFDHKAQLL